MSSAEVQIDWEDRYLDLAHKAQSGIFYHHNRAAFFQRWFRISSFVTLFFGVSAGGTAILDLVSVFPQSGSLIPALTVLLTAVLAANAVLLLAFDVAGNASLHAGLAREWIVNKAEIQRAIRLSTKPNGNAAVAFDQAEDRQHEIDSREPSTNEKLANWAEAKSAHALGLGQPKVMEQRKNLGGESLPKPEA